MCRPTSFDSSSIETSTKQTAAAAAVVVVIALTVSKHGQESMSGKHSAWKALDDYDLDKHTHKSRYHVLFEQNLIQ